MIKLDATDSTNDFLKDLLKEKPMEDGTVVWADFQKKGKGQRKKSWHSVKGKNLTFSILKKYKALPAAYAFQINMGVSLGILNTLKTLNIPDLSVKWPNDILSGGYKLCGILIENTIKSSLISHSVVGVGMNVNQVEFPGLPQARSLKQIMGQEFDRSELLSKLVQGLNDQLTRLRHGKNDAFHTAYENALYRLDQPCTFIHNGNTLEAIVKGISEFGELELQEAGGKRHVLIQGEVQWLNPDWDAD